MKLLSDERALELTELLLQNDKDIKNELEQKIPNIEGLATEEYVKETVSNAQLNGENIDLSEYAKKTDIPDVSNFVEKEDGKGLFSGSYDDLTNKPTIPEEYDDSSLTQRLEDVETSLENKADNSDIHTHTNKEVLDNITSDKITSWDSKATETFVTNAIANAQLSGDGSVDLSGYATKDDLETKADKDHNHDGVYQPVGDYLTEHQDISGKSNVGHTHVLSEITDYTAPDLSDYAKTNDVNTSLNNKADINHKHTMSDITDYTAPDLSTYALKSEIPDVSGFLSEVPEDYVTEEEMADAISEALGTTDSKKLVSISATKTKTTYNVDEEIELDDVVVIAHYSDGSTSEVNNWDSNIDDVNTFVDGYKKLEISYYHNGVTKYASIPLTVNFSNTTDGIQYGYCITDRGRLVHSSNVIKLTSKLLKRSTINVRLKAKVVVERNSNSGYTTLGFGNYSVWKNNTLASITLSPNQKGEFIVECNKEFKYEYDNLKVESEKDTILLSVYNSARDKIDGNFEIIDYSISVTQEAPLVVESISATKTQTRYFIGEDVDTSDIVVTAVMSDDTTKTVSNFSTELDVDDIDDYGKTPISVIYTENGVTNTATITLKMYRPFLTEAQPFEDITNFELHDRLGVGINIGNCLDSKGNPKEDASVCFYDGYLNQETAWGQPEIIRQNFIDIREKGFNTVRIPITWSYNSGILEDSRRHIGKYWLARVNEVVQIGLEEGLYVMINMHHEQPLIYTGVSEPIFENVLKDAFDMWTDIANALKHYNERLIFEGYNEVDNLEGSFTFGAKAAAQMNRLNQVFVDAVRATGSNNAKRVLAVPTTVHMNNVASLNAFVVPTDAVDNKLLLAVHNYPLTFSQDLENTLRPLEEYASKHNLPAVVTEWGTDYKGGNSGESEARLPYGAEQRPDHASNYMARSTRRGIKSYWWDNGSDFTIVIRCNKKIDYEFFDQEFFNTIIDSIFDGYNNYTAFTLPEENIVQYKSFDNLKYERLNLKSGESSYEYWSDVCSDYIPVTGGKGIIIEVVKGTMAVAEKIAFANIVYLDANKVPLESFTAQYMHTYYTGTIPENAAYARFSINSPHNNTKKNTYIEMFEKGDLIINTVTYDRSEIAQVTLPERTVAESIIEKTNQMYSIGDTLDISDISVRTLLDDGTKIFIHDYTIDDSEVNMDISGEYNIKVSYKYKEDTILATIPIFVGEVLASITATKNNLTYFVDSSFDTNDIVVTANYSSGTTTDVTEYCTIDASSVDTSTVGKYFIEISYIEGAVVKTCNIAINVIEFDINNYYDNDVTVIASGDITKNTHEYIILEGNLENYPYVICDNNDPCIFYMSKKPMYVLSNYVVFDRTCTMKQTNNNMPVEITDSISMPVMGNYYTNKAKHWMLKLANYEVKKWTGGNLPS